jgi:prepilin-type N-terminal cleavage/methylation domain-containing protein
MAITVQDPSRNQAESAGFSLIEFLVAMVVLLIGLMGTLALFSHALVALGFSEMNLVAKQKAREAIESIFTARDTAQVSFAQIQNVSNGGIFLDGFNSMTTPGLDGLVGTSDDGAVETMRTAGRNGILGDSDDENLPLNKFDRQIAISTVNGDMRQIIITIRYRTIGGVNRTYQIISYISRFR